MRFLILHWRGQCSLAVTFWLNFVALTLVISAIQRYTHELLADNATQLFYAALVQFVVFRLFVYPWQVVGSIRACERALHGLGESFWPRAFQVVVSLSVVLLFLDGFGVVRAGYASFNVVMAQPIVRDHALSLHAGKTVVHFQGYVDFGATADLRQLLDDNPAVIAVVLDSRGGPVYEARGLAKLIRDRGLDTYSARECSSACVTAFAGGRKRWLAPGAKLGFHLYRLDANHQIPRIDAEEELRKDLAFFEEQQIDVVALEEVFSTYHQQIWYPSPERLLQSGMVHGFVRVPLDDNSDAVSK